MRSNLRLGRGERSPLPILFSFLVLAALSSGALGCSSGLTGATPGPLGEVTVFWEGETNPGNQKIDVTVREVPDLDEAGFYRIRVQDAASNEHTLAYRDPLQVSPFREGDEVSVQVEYVPGMPSPSSVRVWRDEVLEFLAVSDFAPGSRVLKDGTSDLSFSWVVTNDEIPTDNPCIESQMRRILRVTLGNDATSLNQGDIKTVGPYTITCLASREVTYTNRCADAGVFGVSFVARRNATSE
ncbi:MAG: hypothetical protein HKN21_16540 [Candidatus Eisenbacteria bacterium]|uniref:Uncharacterized protein n=1 Tax=Eiseniibacteriota bacterium TaxID=2212470 RepID=A0A7Y2EAQ8_UNCEI|nr:hypothetical protein [Candidatus Eisenbacteria bacterium]